MHLEIARALEGQYEARLGEHASELAEHFSYATDAADLAKAVRYGEVATERARSVYAYGEVARLLERVLQVDELLPPDPAKQCGLLLALGDALLGCGDPRRAAEQAAPNAFKLAESLQDSTKASAACRTAILGIVRFGGITMPSRPAFRRWAERADRYAAPDTPDRVRADISLATVLHEEAREEEASALQARAVALAEKLDDEDALFFVAWMMEAWPARDGRGAISSSVPTSASM